MYVLLMAIVIKELTRDQNDYILKKYWEAELFVETYHLTL